VTPQKIVRRCLLNSSTVEKGVMLVTQTVDLRATNMKKLRQTTDVLE
jgi:hypothetical protein